MENKKLKDESFIKNSEGGFTIKVNPDTDRVAQLFVSPLKEVEVYVKMVKLGVTGFNIETSSNAGAAESLLALCRSIVGLATIMAGEYNLDQFHKKNERRNKNPS
jgi:hypothetical protein